MTKLCNISTT